MLGVLNARTKCFRSLCWTMSVLTVTSPAMMLQAQSPGQNPEPKAYLLPDAAAIVIARPRQLLTSPMVQMYPVEVVTAACLKELGFDPVGVKKVTISITPPMGKAPSYAAVVELVEPVDLGSLSSDLIKHTTPSTLNGRPYLKSAHPLKPSFYYVEPTKLLIAPEQDLQKLLSADHAPPAMASEIQSLEGLDDLLVLCDVATLRPLIQLGLLAAASEIPPEARPFLDLPNQLKRVQLRLSISGSGPCELTVDAENEQSADRVSELIDKALTIYGSTMALQAAQLLASSDPVEQAMGRYLLRTTEQRAEQMRPVRDGERFTIFHADIEGDSTAGLTNIAIIGVLVGLLLPAVQAAREAARRNASMNNMKNIMVALHNYQNRKRSFPAHASYSADGKPLLSWRVHILPELGEKALYDQFHLDEPWDSEHNRQLVAQMPDLFVDPSSGRATTDGRTHYLGALGAGLAFDGTKTGRKFVDFRDGSSNSIMILQVNDKRAAIWTQPDDWQLDSDKPFRGLVPTLHPGVFLAGFVDAHVKSIDQDIDAGVFKHLLTINGGETVQIP